MSRTRSLTLTLLILVGLVVVAWGTWRVSIHLGGGIHRYAYDGVTSYVKAYVKRGKNDAADAEAICEAVTRPSMRFVPVKSAEQQGVLTVHRSRDLLVRQRTMLLNARRGHLGEFGIIAAQGPARVMHLIAELHADGAAGLPDAARSAVLCLFRQLEALTEQIRVLNRRLLAWHRQDLAS